MISHCLFILLIFFAPSSYCQEDDIFYRACANPFDCGNLKNLSYPFWTRSRSQACGLEGFYLQCRDGDFPRITIENQDFLVLAVNQSRNEMEIVRMDVLLGDDICPDNTTTFTNITLDTARFSLVPDFYTKYRNISLFYNCSDDTITSSRKPFSCPVYGEERDAFYVYDGQQIGPVDLINKCSIKVEIPVPITAFDRELSSNDLTRFLGQGFNVSYKYNEDCSSCRESGGRHGGTDTGAPILLIQASFVFALTNPILFLVQIKRAVTQMSRRKFFMLQWWSGHSSHVASFVFS